MITDKKEFVNYCIGFVNGKLKDLLLMQSDLNDSLRNETKSTAGDKHETARAMVQIEQEKLGRHIKEWEITKERLLQLSRSENLLLHKQLIDTNKGLFFVHCHLGKLNFKNLSVMGISPASPLGKELLICNEGVAVNFNGEKYLVLKKY